ncbi:MAG: hypothetical protein E6G46_00450 [Actinobacteria bacterium]|nr:MAG: hypothetical protein E6G46_00450 [Actinomycetota bacterium]
MPAPHWAAVLGAFQPGAATRAAIVNPRGVTSAVRVTTIGPAGTSAQDLSIPAGRLVDIAIGNGAGTFAVVVDADGPVVLALRSVGFVTGASGSSVAIVGESFSEPTPEAVAIDPRTGVPAVVPKS